MKKFVLAFGIPVLAVASLIGSGYATWYFNTNIGSKDENIGLEVTERAVGAKFQHTEKNIKLVLDQTNKTDGMPQDRKGVHFEGTFSESLEADDGDANTLDDEFIDGTVYKVTTTITIPSAVAGYVDFNFTTPTPTDSKTSSATGDLTLKRTKDFTYADLVAGTKNKFKVFDISTDSTDVTVAYATESSTEPSTPKSKEPSTPKAYETMKSALKDQTIKISFEATIIK